MSIKVTVIIPTYNALAFLPETLQSVYAQTFTDYEIVVVDDGSVDETLVWLEAHANDKVRVIAQENQGVSVARNRGVAEAKGEFIAFLDADDLWEPDKLAKQLAVFEQNPQVGLVHTGTRILEADGEFGGVFGVSVGEGLADVIRYNPIRCGSTPMVRRACFDEVGVFDSEIVRSEDWDMWVRIAVSYAFGVVDEPLVIYRQHASNKSKDYTKLLSNMERIVEKIYKNVPADYQRYKPETYGFIYLHTAWRALYAGDSVHAQEWFYKATKHNPKLLSKKNALHLAVRIKLLDWFGMQDWPSFKRSQPSSSDLS